MKKGGGFDSDGIDDDYGAAADDGAHLNWVLWVDVSYSNDFGSLAAANQVSVILSLGAPVSHSGTRSKVTHFEVATGFHHTNTQRLLILIYLNTIWTLGSQNLQAGNTWNSKHPFFRALTCGFIC